ncbi:MAG: LysE family transporter, partial [Pseudohongiellaceae bacterium]
MYWPEFLTIAVAHLFAVASPGPDFAVVTRQSVSAGTRAGLWTSLGVGLGILVHVSYCILGVAVLLSQSPVLFNGMKWVAAAYLSFLGIKAIRAALAGGAPAVVAADDASVRIGRAVLLGFLTNGLNPKATLFFLALFTLVISPQTPTVIQVIYGIYLALATFAWFALLSLLIGKPRVRRFLQGAGNWFEGGMGLVLILLALQLLLTATI